MNVAGRRAALAELVREEIGLRDHLERVAAMRRALGPGPVVERDYRFVDADNNIVALKDLFAPGKDQLLLYHFMYKPDDEKPCPMCTSFADGYDAVAPHVNDVANFVLVAKAPIGKFAGWARGRGWHNIRLLSSYGTSFNEDFGAEDEDGDQIPSISVFTKDAAGTVRHFYQKFASLAEDVNRGIDLYGPLWNLLDLLPKGRPDDWHPKHSYGR
jgi:predicted dithiol-disulfide oxidoreductase (DUF899 family)